LCAASFLFRIAVESESCFALWAEVSQDLGEGEGFTLSCFADGGWNVKVDGTSGVGMGERKVREKWKDLQTKRREKKTGGDWEEREMEDRKERAKMKKIFD